MTHRMLYTDDSPIGFGGMSPVVRALMADARNSELYVVGPPSKVGTLHPSYLQGPRFGSRGFGRGTIVRLLLLLIDMLTILFRPFAKDIRRPRLLLIAVGRDLLTVSRGLVAAWRVNPERKGIYIVDLPFLGAKHSSTAMLFVRKAVCRMMFSCFDVRVAITSELAQAMEELTGRSWRTAALPFELDMGRKSTIRRMPERVERSRRFAFLGGYSQAMDEAMAWFFSNYERHYASDYFITIYTASRQATTMPWLEGAIALRRAEVVHSLSDDEVVRHAGTNAVFMCPYPFSREHFDLVRYSFPSKLLKLIGLGLPPLLIGPRESPAMRSHATFVPAVCSEEDIASLPEVLVKSFAFAASDLPSELVRLHRPETFWSMFEDEEGVQV